MGHCVRLFSCKEVCLLSLDQRCRHCDRVRREFGRIIRTQRWHHRLPGAAS